MSWISDYISEKYETYNQYAGLISSLLYGNDSAITNHYNDEKSKADLRGAEVEQFLGGVPVVKDFVQGIEGINQLEDLYANTGEVPAYPVGKANAQGASSLGKGISKLAKIESGANDLYDYYAGEKDGFRSFLK